jgi:hypothetical protein
MRLCEEGNMSLETEKIFLRSFCGLCMKDGWRKEGGVAVFLKKDRLL